jgi:hypothetical protein
VFQFYISLCFQGDLGMTLKKRKRKKRERKRGKSEMREGEK